MTYTEDKNPLTGKAEDHRKAKLKSLRNIGATIISPNKDTYRKSLRDIIGHRDYLILSENKYGNEILYLLEKYGRISQNIATDEEINKTFLFIKSRLNNTINTYKIISKEEKKISGNNISEEKVLESIIKVEKLFNNATYRSDKVIAIDSFISIAHRSGTSIISRLWTNEKGSYYEEMRTLEFIKFEKIIDKYLDYLFKG